MFMSMFILAAIIILGLAGAMFHKMNIDKIYKEVTVLSATLPSETQHKNNLDEKDKVDHKNDEKIKSEKDKRADFLLFLYNPQGSTFNALAISGWLLLIVGIFFTFFLTPQISDNWTFLKTTYLVASSLGFFFFGLEAIIIGLLIVVVLRVPDVYSQYIIPKKLKRAIMSSCLFLLVPIFIPAYIATVYPFTEDVSGWINAAFASLVISQVLLLSPIYIKALGVKI
jgi:hypothetical protein